MKFYTILIAVRKKANEWKRNPICLRLERTEGDILQKDNKYTAVYTKYVREVFDQFYGIWLASFFF